MKVRNWSESDIYYGGLHVLDTLVKIAGSSDDEALADARRELVRRAFAASDAGDGANTARVLESEFGSMPFMGNALRNVTDRARGKSIRERENLEFAQDARGRAQLAKGLADVEGGNNLFRGVGVRSGAISKDEVGRSVGVSAQKMMKGHTDAIKAAAKKDYTKSMIEGNAASEKRGLALRDKKRAEATQRTIDIIEGTNRSQALGLQLRDKKRAEAKQRNSDIIEETNRNEALGAQLVAKKRAEAAKAKGLASAVSAGPPTPKAAVELQDALSAGPPTPLKKVYDSAKKAPAPKAAATRDTLMGALNNMKMNAIAQAPVRTVQRAAGTAHAAQQDKKIRGGLASGMRAQATAMEEGRAAPKAPADKKKDDEQLASE